MQINKHYPIWHPFSQMKDFDKIPKLVKGKGVYLWDNEGNRYLDAIGSWWVTLHGHSNEHIQEAVSKQMGELEHAIFAGFTHEPAVELCSRLQKHLPGKDLEWKFFFSDNGSTAVEVALKMAIQYYVQKKNSTKINIITLDGAYHGDTIGAMSAGHRDVFSKPFENHLFEAITLPFPKDENLPEIVKIFSSIKNQHNILIYEPLVQGASGMRMMSVEDLEYVLGCACDHGAILIADEVMTGFGRTGTWFASEQTNVIPHLMCLSKGLTGGALPMSLTVSQPWLYEAFLHEDFDQGFLHGHSFTGNPLGCAAANASLDIMENPETWKKIEMIQEVYEKYEKSWSDHPFLENIRYKGIVFAADVASDDEHHYLNNLRKPLYKEFMSRGLLIRPLGNTVYLLPPYCIELDELVFCLESLHEVTMKMFFNKEDEFEN